MTGDIITQRELRALSALNDALNMTCDSLAVRLDNGATVEPGEIGLGRANNPLLEESICSDLGPIDLFLESERPEYFKPGETFESFDSAA